MTALRTQRNLRRMGLGKRPQFLKIMKGRSCSIWVHTLVKLFLATIGNRNLRSISNKRCMNRAKLPNLQQGSSNKNQSIGNLTKTINSRAKKSVRDSIARSNPKPRSKQSLLSTQKNSGIPLNNHINTRKFSKQNSKKSTQNLTYRNNPTKNSAFKAKFHHKAQSPLLYSFSSPYLSFNASS
jgi:hypothetical protein